MEIARLVHEYLQTLVWPCLVIGLLFIYHDVIASLVPGSKIKFTISGVTIETTIPVLVKSVSESLRGRNLEDGHWEWLRKLRDKGRLPYQHQEETYKNYLRPLRNSGLIREHPEGWLTTAKEIEITTLGKLLLEAHERTEAPLKVNTNQ